MNDRDEKLNLDINSDGVSAENNFMVVVPKKVLLTQTCNPYIVGPGEQLNYALSIENNSGKAITGVKLFDSIPKNTILINDKIIVDDIEKEVISPINISIPDIDDKQVTIIEFTLKTLDKPCNLYKIENEAIVSYETRDDLGKDITNSVKDSNIIASIKSTIVKVSKFADKNVIALGDIITYIISIVNTGNEKIKDVVIKEEIPYALSYKFATLRVDGININDENFLNIKIGDMKPSEKRIIIYQAELFSYPMEDEIASSTKVNYKLVIDKDREKEYKLDSNTVVTEVMKRNFNRVYFRR